MDKKYNVFLQLIKNIKWWKIAVFLENKTLAITEKLPSDQVNQLHHTKLLLISFL